MLESRFDVMAYLRGILLLRQVLIVTVLASPPFFYFQTTSANASQISSIEQATIDLIDGETAYSYASSLEAIGLSYPGFRSAGSAGANASALWLASQLQNLGLEATLEHFPFKVYDLPSKPALTIDLDGLASTIDDQQTIASFHSEHYSWPTQEQGVFGDLVVLPLHDASSPDDLGSQPVDLAAWSRISTSGKIVLTSRYVRNAATLAWFDEFTEKITQQRPKAVIFDTYYNWAPEVPYPGLVSMSSAGGYPLWPTPGLYWDLGIPTGRVSYSDGLRIRELERAEDISANFSVPAHMADGTQLNVVARLPGVTHPEKQVLVTGHYDSVLTPGFGDNAAGVAGILEIARVLTEAKKNGLYNPSYTVVFIAFTAEELGFIGSANYLQAHKAEADGIVAVLNLDAIGSKEFAVTTTDPAVDFDLDRVIGDAATDLGIPFSLWEQGGSDQETFRIPFETADGISYTWHVDVGIRDAPSTTSSALLISSPLFPSESPPGWIHTNYDNSSSTADFGWIMPDKLAEHIGIAALSLLRINPSTITTTTTTTTTVPTTTTTTTISTTSTTTTTTIPSTTTTTPVPLASVSLYVTAGILIGSLLRRRRGR